MRITRVNNVDRQATHELIFSHMSASELDSFKSNNPEVYQSVMDILNNEYGICIVAKEDGRVIGYLMAASKSNGASAIKYAELRDMRVQKDYQGKGVGSLLVKEFIRWAEAEGYERLRVDVYALSEKNIGYYQKFGFVSKTLTMERWFS
jgi:GNAT superfamily N-acetyltransferase